MSDTTAFAISGSSNPGVVNDYQKLQMSSNGAFGKNFSRRSTKLQMAADGGDGPSFFDIETKKLDESWSGKMGDLVKDKKAILIVNVASE